MKQSLRVRALLASGVLLLISMGLVMLSVMRSFESAQYGSIMKELTADANVLLTAARVVDGELLMPEKMPDEQFNEVESMVLGMVFDCSGRMLWRSRSTLDEVVNYRPELDQKDMDFDRITDESGDYFVYNISVSLGEKPLVFVALIPAREYSELLVSFRHSLLLWLGLTAAAMLVMIWFGMNWSFQPIRRLAQNLKDIESARVGQLDGEYPREISSLTDALNQLLLNERRQREKYRDAMADLAHSLKTPLAVLQSVQHSQLVRRNGDRDPDAAELEKTVDEQVQRMNQIIGYQLQRAVTHYQGLVKQQVDVGNVVERISRTLDKVYRDKQVQLSFTLGEGAVFTGDIQDLMEILGNLLENAYRLCLQQVRVTASCYEYSNGRQGLELLVEDDGQGVPEEKRQVILKRGVREDSRTPGQGIGLAVTVDIIDNYDGSLEIGDSDLGGALFQIHIPG